MLGGGVVTIRGGRQSLIDYGRVDLGHVQNGRALVPSPLRAAAGEVALAEVPLERAVVGVGIFRLLTGVFHVDVRQLALIRPRFVVGFGYLAAELV